MHLFKTSVSPQQRRLCWLYFMFIVFAFLCLTTTTVVPIVRADITLCETESLALDNCSHDVANFTKCCDEGAALFCCMKKYSTSSLPTVIDQLIEQLTTVCPEFQECSAVSTLYSLSLLLISMVFYHLV